MSFPQLRNVQADLAQSVNRKLNAVASIHKLGGNDTASHDSRPLSETLAPFGKVIDQPCQGFERMAERIPTMTLADDFTIDAHRALSGSEVERLPINDGLT